eukprot:gene767-58_t
MAGVVYGEKDLANVISVLRSKPIACIKIIRRMVFQAVSDVVTTSDIAVVAVYAKKGLANAYSNCSLNCCLSVLLGTVLRTYIVHPEYKEFSAMRELHKIACHISSPSVNSKQHVLDAVEDLSEKAEMPLHTNTKHDSIELFEKSLEHFL